MITYSQINTICDTIRSTIASSSALAITDENGNTVYPQVLDRDEHPAVIADSPAGLPAICVMPFGDRAADNNYFISGPDNEVNFNVVIAGYYRATSNETRGEDIYADIDTLRQKATDCANLFAGSGAFFTPGVVYHSRVELGYFEVVDYVIYKFIVTLNMKTIIG